MRNLVKKISESVLKGPMCAICVEHDLDAFSGMQDILPSPTLIQLPQKHLSIV